MRLLNLVQPRRAYFGEKDLQQLRLIQGMVDAFFLDVDIISCATVREPDGLAMSSRNSRLNESQRRQAAELYTTLKQCLSAPQARDRLSKLGFEVEYVDDIAGRRLAAVRLGDVRLIDNVELKTHA
jgi:pantoate--beta-alanine ligase